MRLTTFTDYSLRVLLFLASAPEGRGTIADVARTYRISENHVVKVVHRLGKHGLLANARGRGGGLRLARAPELINVGQVVRATEEPSLLVECFSAEGGCAITGACRLAGVLAKAHAAFYKVLDGFTLADLLERPRRLTHILHFTTMENA